MAKHDFNPWRDPWLIGSAIIICIAVATVALSGCKLSTPLDSAVTSDVDVTVNVDQAVDQSNTQQTAAVRPRPTPTEAATVRPTAAATDGGIRQRQRQIAAADTHVGDTSTDVSTEVVDDAVDMPGEGSTSVAFETLGPWVTLPPYNPAADPVDVDPVDVEVPAPAPADPTWASTWVEYDIMSGWAAAQQPVPDITAAGLGASASWTAPIVGDINPGAPHLDDAKFTLTWNSARPLNVVGETSFAIVGQGDLDGRRLTLARYNAKLEGHRFSPLYKNDAGWDGKGFAGHFNADWTGIEGRVKTPHIAGTFGE